MAGIAATVYEAHEYEPASKTADPHGHDDSCACDPRCKVCGSGNDAYIHSEEALDKGATVTVTSVSAQDDGAAAEAAG